MSLSTHFDHPMSALGLSLAILALNFPAFAQEVLPELVVTTASPLAQKATGAMATNGNVPVTIRPSQDLRAAGGATLGEALADQPGIATSGFAPSAASRPVIRGLDGARVRIQENGVGVHDVSTLGEDHAVPLDPLATEQLEVVRGPATLRYGSQACSQTRSTARTA